MIIDVQKINMDSIRISHAVVKSDDVISYVVVKFEIESVGMFTADIYKKNGKFSIEDLNLIPAPTPDYSVDRKVEKELYNEIMMVLLKKLQDSFEKYEWVN